MNVPITLDTALPHAPFIEVHRRTIDAPIERVWPAALSVTAREVRTLGPLMAVRSLPARLRRVPIELSADFALLDVFVDEGFVVLRRDDVPIDGRAAVVFGAIGKFWSVMGNAPLPVAPDEFAAFDQPDYAVIAASLHATDLCDGRTRIETETRVTGTDDVATRKFAPYWALIRPFSGLIRRSWLAAIERRSQRA